MHSRVLSRPILCLASLKKIKENFAIFSNGGEEVVFPWSKVFPAQIFYARWWIQDDRQNSES